MQTTVLPSSITEHATYRSDTEELTGGKLRKGRVTALLGVFKARISYIHTGQKAGHAHKLKKGSRKLSMISQQLKVIKIF